MTYHISGLDPAPFAALSSLSDQELANRSILRMEVTRAPGFPCRISLDDAEVGSTVLLLNHTSVANGPYAATQAIFVGEGLKEAAFYLGEVPPALERRILSLRAFDERHMMVEAALAQPGEADAAIRSLFGNQAVRYIHAHNATRGCFAAAVERT